jgi:hypothetical protein
VVEALLSAGIPLSKLDKDALFSSLLSTGRAPLPKAKELEDLIPAVHGKELGLVKSELQGRHVSVIYDGTTSVAEVIAVVLR